MVMPDLSQLSINQATTRAQWTLREAAEGYARAGVPGIAIWRDKLTECGVGEAARILAGEGLTVTGLCRGGMFPAVDVVGRNAAIADNQQGRMLISITLDGQVWAGSQSVTLDEL